MGLVVASSFAAVRCASTLLLLLLLLLRGRVLRLLTLLRVLLLLMLVWLSLLLLWMLTLLMSVASMLVLLVPVHVRTDRPPMPVTFPMAMMVGTRRRPESRVVIKFDQGSQRLFLRQRILYVRLDIRSTQPFVPQIGPAVEVDARDDPHIALSPLPAAEWNLTLDHLQHVQFQP